MTVHLLEVGFTGTRTGLTYRQALTIKALLRACQLKTFHHGDCRGADEQAHNLVRELWPRAVIHGHPCNIRALRAMCKVDVEWPEDEPLRRNNTIVRVTEVLIAAPRGDREERRSGTWATIRNARRMKKPIAIVTPAGELIPWPNLAALKRLFDLNNWQDVQGRLRLPLTYTL